jgi:hypothetical protein
MEMWRDTAEELGLDAKSAHAVVNEVRTRGVPSNPSLRVTRR